MFATIKSWFVSKPVEPSPIQASPDELIEAFESVLKLRFGQAPATEPVKGITPVASYAGGESIFTVVARNIVQSTKHYTKVARDFCVELAHESVTFAEWVAESVWGYLVSLPVALYYVTINLPAITKAFATFTYEWIMARSVQVYVTLRHWSVKEGHRAGWIKQQRMRLGTYASIVARATVVPGHVSETVSYVLSDFSVLSASLTENGHVFVIKGKPYTDKSKIAFAYPVQYSIMSDRVDVMESNKKADRDSFLAVVSDILKENHPEILAELAVHGLDPKQHTYGAVLKRAAQVTQPIDPVQETGTEQVSKEVQPEVKLATKPAETTAKPVIDPKHAEFQEHVAQRFGQAQPKTDTVTGVSPNGDFVATETEVENGNVRINVRVQPSSTFPVIKDREALASFDAAIKTMAITLKNENDPLTGNSMAYHPESDSIHVSGSGIRLVVQRVKRADGQISMVLTTTDWKKLGEVLNFNFKGVKDKFFIKNHAILAKLIGNGLQVPGIYQ